MTTVLLTGCRDGAVDDGAGFTWQEPAWVAQFRQDQEEFQLAQIACWAEFGFDKVNDPAGGVMLADFDAEQPPGWFELFESAGFECLERTKHLAWALPLPFDEEAYQRVLDTRDCLLAHGHHVSEPPTFEVWREDVLAWSPHGDVFEGLQRQGIGTSAADWAAMNADCPQPTSSLFGLYGLQ